MTLTLVTDHVDEALALLLTQFKGKTGVEQWIASYVTQIQEIENAIYDVFTKRLDIDEAEGVQLDIIGVIIGLQRETNMIDADYRERLKVQVLINLSSGTIPELNEIMDRLLASPFSIERAGVATAIMAVIEPITNAVALVAVLKKAKAAGVKFFLQFVDASTGDTFFSLGPDLDVEGFSFGLDSAGGFAAILEVD